jgi:hypothetical protein
LLEMSPGYPKGLRCLLHRKGLNGSILGSLHPALSTPPLHLTPASTGRTYQEHI